MGGVLGTLVAALLEDEPWVGELVGIDADPPRYRLKRTVFHRIRPGEHDRIVSTITDFDPHVLVYMGVWEPDARAGPELAAQLTDESAISVLGAAAECPSLESVVIRSGIEVYGRAKRSLTRPDESTRRRPTSDWGRTVDSIERTAARVGERVGVTVGTLRLAPVLGPHVPSPLGRLLRQPVVPYSMLADPPFAVIEDRDAARAFVAAAKQRLAEPVNVVAPGAITVRQAARRGRRIPLPLVGPEWRLVRPASYVLGAPIPDHVHELLHRGRLADGSAMRSILGITTDAGTVDVIDGLYRWPSIVRRPAQRQVA
jgi:UDP-glucose 4-epimerase